MRSAASLNRPGEGRCGRRWTRPRPLRGWATPTRCSRERSGPRSAGPLNGTWAGAGTTSANGHLDRPFGDAKVDEPGAGVRRALLESQPYPPARLGRSRAQEHVASSSGSQQLARGQVVAGQADDALDFRGGCPRIEPPVQVPRPRDAAMQCGLVAFLKGAVQMLGVGADQVQGPKRGRPPEEHVVHDLLEDV